MSRFKSYARESVDEVTDRATARYSHVRSHLSSISKQSLEDSKMSRVILRIIGAIFLIIYVSTTSAIIIDLVYDSYSRPIPFTSKEVITLVLILVMNILVLTCINLVYQIVIHKKTTRERKALSDFREMRLEKQALEKDLNSQRFQFDRIAEHAAEISLSRAHINQYISDILYSRKFNSTDLHLSVQKYINHTLEATRLIFEEITQEKCGVSIKRLQSSQQGAALVSTYARDSSSWVKRAPTDLNPKLQLYSYEDNYAFKLLLDPVSSTDFWCCDDLDENDDYYNSNDNWKKYYNATAVFLIQRPLIAQGSTETISADTTADYFGFLCVDNYRGSFESNSTFAHSTLAAISNGIYYVERIRTAIMESSQFRNF